MSGARDETEKSMSWTEAVAGALGSHEVSLRANAVSQLLELNKVVQQARQAAAAPAAAAGSGDELDRVINLIENLYEHIDRLKKDVAELNNTQLRDGGTWNAKTVYRPNELVTAAGTLWLCKLANANSHPPSDNWRLMVKTKGRP